MKSEKHEQMKNHIPEEARAHYKKARAEMRKSVEGLLPPKFAEHHKAARKEMLLAAQEMISFAISKLEKSDAS